MLTVSEVSKAYGPTQALDRVSLTVRRGSVHALLGGNGSGKSTLIKILAGVVRADGGSVTFGDVKFDASSITPTVAVESRCFFVHQDLGIFPELSIADNLHLGSGFRPTRTGRIRWGEVRRRTREILELYEIDAEPDALLSELWLANRTKVAIARALQGYEDSDGGVLVLDEPTASLPANEVEYLLGALRRYADAGQAIVFVTHRLAEACEIADSATVLRNGQALATLSRDEITLERLTDLIVGEDGLTGAATVPRSSTGRAILEVSGLSGQGIGECTFDLHQGEIVGLAGLIGAGGSTVLQLLFGLVPAAAGEVKLAGQPLRFRSPRDAMSAGFAYVPADRKQKAVFADLSVGENLAMAVVNTYWRRGRLRRGQERSDSRRIIAEQSIKADSEMASLSSLSGGNQQRVVLARWLRRDPIVLLLDEPTQGVDVGARSAIHQRIRDFVAGGVGAIIASSDEEELAAVCDRVLILRRGEVSAMLAGDEITAERIARLALAEAGNE